MHDPFLKSFFADGRIVETLVRDHLPGGAAVLDMTAQMPLMSGRSWEGCLGGPSSQEARPAAFLFGGSGACRSPIPGQQRPWTAKIMHLLYLDDSGSAGNPNEEYLVLGGVSVYEAQANWITRRMDELAERRFSGYPSSFELWGHNGE